MRPVSAAFLRTVTGSHKMIARATVCNTFQTGTQPAGMRIPILAGDVQIDGTADVRSTLDLTTSGVNTWPVRANDSLAPYGNEIYVERGIQYSDELAEYVGLGYFRIQSPGQDKAPVGPIRVAGQDRMKAIIDARLLGPVQFVAGASLSFVFTTLIQQVYPAAVVVFDDASGSNVLTRSVTADEDRFGFLDNLVKSLGKIWYWNHRGELVIKDVPSPAQPVIEIMSGASGMMMDLGRKLTREGVYNAVVATGNGQDGNPPVRGVAFDNNPLSPTYYAGRFGPVPRFYSSQFLATTAQAIEAATAMLQRSLGLPYSVDFTSTPNPALEPWDPVRVRSRDDQASETHVIESLTVPLVQDGEFKVKTREQTVVLIGSAG